MIPGINPDFVERMSISWNEGRFIDVYNMTFEYYCALRQDIDRSRAGEEVQHIEKAERRLPIIRSMLADMDAFMEAQLSGADATA